MRKKRQAAGISQEERTLRINVDQAYVSRVESGEMNVTLETMQRVADALKSLTLDPGSGAGERDIKRRGSNTRSPNLIQESGRLDTKPNNSVPRA